MEEAISNINNVVKYLRENGWDVNRSSLYRHVNQKKLQPNKDGVFSIIDVEKYARRHLRRLSANPDETIRFIKNVLRYLIARGWDVKKSTLYRHIERRKLKPNKDSVFSIIDIEKYAHSNLRRLCANPNEITNLFKNNMRIFVENKADEIAKYIDSNYSHFEDFKAFFLIEIEDFFHLDKDNQI